MRADEQSQRPGPGEDYNPGPPVTPRQAASVIVLRGGSESLEVLLVQGPARDLRRLADTLAACKGVKHARLHLTATAMPPLL